VTLHRHHHHHLPPPPPASPAARAGEINPPRDARERSTKDGLLAWLFGVPRPLPPLSHSLPFSCARARNVSFSLTVPWETADCSI